jgi:hypothetical protein
VNRQCGFGGFGCEGLIIFRRREYFPLWRISLPLVLRFLLEWSPLGEVPLIRDADRRVIKLRVENARPEMRVVLAHSRQEQSGERQSERA